MSGICGMIHWDGQPVASGSVQAMAEAAVHRGPDGIHYRTCGQAGFAHLALHITPESVRERQPLAGPQGQTLLVADARIDNRDDLIQLFVEKQLLTGIEATDPEIILAAYRLWGTDCAAHLLGDFAFAIWDASQQRFFAARDPMGMRAFYYWFDPHRFLFATEVKQILAAPKVPVRLFEPAIAAHLLSSFQHQNWTCYQGIQQLPGAHALQADASGVREWRFWDVDPGIRIRYRDESQYIDHFRELFQKAVACRLRGNRASAISLSGGLDSGSIASMAGWLGKNGSVPRIRAYSYAMEDLPQCDERYISDAIVNFYDLPVTYISSAEAWPLKDFPRHGPDVDDPMTGHYQPLIETTAARASSDGLRLMVYGIGGDLMMGEYLYDYPGLFISGKWKTLLRELGMQRRWRRLSYWKAFDRFLIRPLPQVLWPPGRAPRIRELARRARPWTRRPRCYPAWLRKDWLQSLGAETLDDPPIPRVHVPGFARRSRYSLVFTPSHYRIAVWLERTHARFGMGFADPWSDRRIAEFAIAVPQRLLNRTGQDKRLVRMAMQGIMPETARSSARKILPSPLLDLALRQKEQNTVQVLITASRAAEMGFVDEAQLRLEYESIRSGKGDDGSFWAALELEMWLRGNAMIVT